MTRGEDRGLEHRERPLRSTLPLALLLLAGTLALHARTGRFEFTNFDDDIYVTANPLVRAGLTWEGVRTAFTTGHAANWHPLTWLSHMLDVELFDLEAGKHHLVSACWHAANAALLFAALRSLTLALWPSFFAAALFALHPLRAESVAWIAERKDVLSGFFWMASLWAYGAWARRGGLGRYLLLCALFALGLLAKPMLVTLPLVLLLLDIWPLARLPIGPAPARPLPSLAPTHPGQTHRVRSGLDLIAEKIPLLALSLASAVVTWRVQQAGGAIGPLEAIGFETRAANAIQSYATYAAKTLWPSGLCAFYPHEGIGDPAFDPWTARVFASLALLVVTSALALRGRARAPAVLVGWLWFLGTLVPVIGLVQVGLQAWADRYTYLPSIGLSIAIVWGALALVPLVDRQRRVLVPAALVALAALALAALALASWRQLGTWRDSASVFARALAVTEGNFLAHVNLGQALQAQGKLDQAAEHFLAALQLRPQLAPARFDLARVRRAQRRTEEARAELERSLAIDPRYADAHADLGWLLAEGGRDREALPHLRAAAELAPEEPAYRNNLAWVLATSRTDALPEEALAIAGELCRSSAAQPGFLETLAAALARVGRFEEAVRWQNLALSGVPPRARAALEARLELYRSGQPFLKTP